MSDGGLGGLYREHLPQVHWQRIETPLTGGGVPDSNGCHLGSEFWIENKWTRGWKPKIRPFQVGWIERRLRAGGRVFVAVRRQAQAGRRRGAAVDELWLFRGEAVRALKVDGMRAVDRGMLLGVWTGGPSSWNWTEFLEHLVD